MTIELPDKSKINLPDHKQLEELFFKLYHLKVLVDKSEEQINKYDKEMKIINNSSIMKRYRLIELRLKRFVDDVKYNEKKFKTLFEEYVK